MRIYIRVAQQPLQLFHQARLEMVFDLVGGIVDVVCGRAHLVNRVALPETVAADDFGNLLLSPGGQRNRSVVDRQLAAGNTAPQGG